MGSIPDSSNPLGSFVTLSPTVYMRDPSKNGLSTTNRSPTTIVILFWMNADSRHTAKYLSEYIKLAPTARIIYVTTTIQDFIIRPSPAYQQQRLKPAVDAIRASAETETGGSVFLHAFSNAGVFAARHLSAAYLDATGEKLPLKSMVLDSAPGKATFSVTVKVLSYLIPRSGLLRFFGKVLIYAFTMFYWMVARLARLEDEVMVSRKAVNDATLVPEEIERCYIYSDKDELVGWKNVEEHSHEAEKKGWNVTREKFVGAPHVGNMRIDPERYWRIIMKIMNGQRLDERNLPVNKLSQ
ncbi:hypothetical protein FQN54_007741 [Arachnomyces sp. PD_36]|nr:hypothetical protein FQN54_007741 [Arachnomyces sp. PD_36]